MDIERLKELKEWVNNAWYSVINNAISEYPDYYGNNMGRQDLIKLIDAAIARQSVKSEDVQEAIEFMKKEVKMLENWIDRTGDCFDKNLAMFKTILTALQAYEPKGE